jgi:hypothetical protein
LPLNLVRKKAIREMTQAMDAYAANSLREYRPEAYIKQMSGNTMKGVMKVFIVVNIAMQRA